MNVAASAYLISAKSVIGTMNEQNTTYPRDNGSETMNVAVSGTIPSDKTPNPTRASFFKATLASKLVAFAGGMFFADAMLLFFLRRSFDTAISSIPTAATNPAKDFVMPLAASIICIAVSIVASPNDSEQPRPAGVGADSFE
jgi:hypothetical protein